MHSQQSNYSRGGAMMDSSRYGGNNSNSFNKSSGGSSNYQTSYYQRPIQHPSLMMMAGARPQVPPHHYQQNGDHFRRGGAGDGATLRGRGGFGMMRGGYSRPEVTNSSRNEEVRGGRFDNRSHYGGDHRYSHNYEGGSSSVQGRPTTNRLREP